MDSKADLWMTVIAFGLGVVGFLVLLTLFAIGRDVPGYWVVADGGLLGLRYLPWANKGEK